MDFMKLAFEYAQEALANQEVPVGCIFVYESTVIANGRNTVNKTKNSTRHAEFNCIDTTYEYCRDNNLNANDVFAKIDVFVTLEPCIMCMAALSNVNSVTYSCHNDRFGGLTVVDVPKHSHMTCQIIHDKRFSEDTMKLLKDFYMGVNPNAPVPKTKGKNRRNKDNLS